MRRRWPKTTPPSASRSTNSVKKRAHTASALKWAFADCETENVTADRAVSGRFQQGTGAFEVAPDAIPPFPERPGRSRGNAADDGRGDQGCETDVEAGGSTLALVTLHRMLNVGDRPELQTESGMAQKANYFNLRLRRHQLWEICQRKRPCNRPFQLLRLLNRPRHPSILP
jgi:hypothetical protein